MTQIRCLMAGMRSGVLADIVQQLLRNHLEVKLMNRVRDRQKVLPLVRKHHYNVVMLNFEPDEIPDICHQLLEEHPDMVVAGMVEDGKRLCILVDDPDPHELTEMIRLAVDGSQ